MKHLLPADEFDMIWQWARAENQSDRFGPLYCLSTAIRQQLVSDNPSVLTPQDRATLKSEVLRIRGPLLRGLIRLCACWYTTVFELQDLARVETMYWPPFVAIAPSRKLNDFVAALDKGISTPNDDFLNTYRRMRAKFSIREMHGHPIFVSETDSGPYILVEGYSRLTSLNSQYMNGELSLGTFSAVLGICPNLRDWSLNDNPE
jgi:hypothetical protein